MLTLQKLEELQFNEMAEEEAPKALQLEQGQFWNAFQATEFREWEMWAARVADVRGRDVKRARVHGLIQGEGGRKIKSKNGVLALKPAELLSCNVAVHQAADLEDEVAHRLRQLRWSGQRPIRRVRWKQSRCRGPT